MKLQKKIEQFHEKRPYIEPFLLFVTTSLFGSMLSFSISIFISNQHKNLFGNIYCWISIIIGIVIFLYYKYFSTYSPKFKKNKIENKEDFLSAYLNEATNDMKQGDVDAFKKSTYIFQNTIMQLNRVREDEKQDEKQ